MLNKSLALGILAAFAMAPAAFANQVQGNETNTNINVGNVGNNNVVGITNNTSVRQTQGKKSHGRYWCSGSNISQVQGNATNSFISAGNVGNGNVIGINNNTRVRQRQVANSCH